MLYFLPESGPRIRGESECQHYPLMLSLILIPKCTLALFPAFREQIRRVEHWTNFSKTSEKCSPYVSKSNQNSLRIYLHLLAYFKSKYRLATTHFRSTACNAAS